MTLFTILLGISLSLTFACSNAATYRMGNKAGRDEGYREGLEEGITAQFVKLHDGEWEITTERYEDD